MLTEKQLELLLNGAVGIVGTIVGAIVTLVSTSLADNRRRNREAQSAFRLFQSEMEEMTDIQAISNTLRRLREFMLNGFELLHLSPNREFFTKWLQYPALLSGKAHSGLEERNLGELKHEVKSLTT